MHEYEMKTKSLSDMKHTLIEAMQGQLSKGVECVDTDEAGKVVDMIKDLAEAEKDCVKAWYYAEVIEAMKKHDHEARYDYDPKALPNWDETYQRPWDDTFQRAEKDWNRNVDKTSRYGYTYDSYESAKRSYDATKSQPDKEEMDKHAKEYLTDSIHSMREIWASADPTLKKKMKADLTSLLGEMTV